ncbi:bifunctional DNA-formamidopyrimidine glycosylase/DNA-(apurinic or apyrimidinic site) lyase [Corynebacterium sp. 3HC-13]|uniref:bifunctional DNA-formamidopyrimidine glycosylase/DNA-(apurinic or apyrimidinic site) lyase n=1 Tax=Corynebacterium poyangense TaxID=2684405 RepID=UPI001CCC1A91|nr:bifunctional DNA-formamidopyrimidine glycosylase/DNA-(apurinic or apyrimidinic site) lyase [Corynebacterium poyangense]MBZ8178084.1 bifunctional DNA-formamidopyrimidine glycosylase/DNA-(apurinic or apyrimidinic site) lyase [Corynebacterium poyangense]
MPELPEVEVVRRGLESHLLGTSFHHVEVYHPRANRGQDGDLAALLGNSKITAIRRRGKYMWFDLNHGDSALFVHLGMSGQMLVGPPGQVTSPHLRIKALLSDLLHPEAPMKQLSFLDQRTFGRWLWCPYDETGVPVPVSHIAIDPLDQDFDSRVCARRIRTKRSEIKRVILDQTVVSGIGNIYADEALWAAGIKPTRKAYRLRFTDVVTLLSCVQEVMLKALAAGGTSFDSLYVNVNGASGYFSRSLVVYGQEGRACPRCGTTIQRVSWMNRSTHWCPGCQLL